ncbi:hypothetical protein VCHA35O142_10831 [Vibrio chagasii]|nr:hypothetical protein VCHA35O142_10831 [Vibrio chagasii]CAH7007824.1 hypothetical protein VCHA34P112_40282 [Vibrio chagasii]CAH7300771.1 hypothetical protein VCHA48P442_30480 [Vibrio chagasii]
MLKTNVRIEAWLITNQDKTNDPRIGDFNRFAVACDNAETNSFMNLPMK